MDVGGSLASLAPHTDTLEPTEATRLLIGSGPSSHPLGEVIEVPRANPGSIGSYGSQTIGEEDVQLEFTYWYMKKRQWSRLQRGTFTNERRTFSFWFFVLYSSIYSAYLTLQLVYYHRRDGYYLEFILMGFVSITLGILTPRFGWFVRFIFFEGYLCLFIFFIEDLYYQKTAVIMLSSGLCALVVFTVICFFIYPYLLRCYLSCTGNLSMKFDKDSFKKGEANRYLIRQKGCFRSGHQCVYEGPLHLGKPHGIGTWMDTSYQGELLAGYWEQGIPVGPFESIENDTRSFLVNLRIIFGTNGGGKWWLDRTPLNMGAASVECCVSGNFFKGFPKVFMIKGPDECVCANRHECTCVKNLLRTKHYKHIDDEKSLRSVVVSIDRKHATLAVSGHKPRRDREKNVSITIARDMKSPAAPLYSNTQHSGLLKNSGSGGGGGGGMGGASGGGSGGVSGGSGGMGGSGGASSSSNENVGNYHLVLDQQWISSEQREGILFIHGFDHDLKDSLKRFGQFLALGHFPKYILPFVFNWPSSTNGLMYWCAQGVASDTDNHRDLRRFLHSLRMAGIRQLHVLCHSMGTRFFLRSFSHTKKAFHKRIINNDSYRDLLGDLDQPPPEQQRVNDSNDDDDIEKGGQMKINLANIILLNPDYEIETFKNDYSDLRMYCSRITIYADHRDEAIRIAHKLNQKTNLGNNIAPLLDHKGLFLDIDIIDTGDLDSNMSERHHSFFNINRLMVDDLHDLIVTGKRAEERTSRLKSTGKVFRFTILPSSVVMV